ncbi:glycerophosphodiester phosphodiesterase [Gaopeijia maritima]|uniref:Glycerophosphodiester phosphodiesterase n=1 Tax=Gaopeijia maritima TaxID=3119007 RepID=A0ABU9EBG7_9BACT
MTLSEEIIAHRGYSAVAPENTLAAVEKALEAGADAVEWDVHVASCGTPVLVHDAALGRTTNGFGPVRRRSLAQLQSLDAGSWFDAAFAGERIPSLREALEHVKGRVGRVYCEVKGYRELEDLDRMARIVREADLAYDTVFISMDWGILERIAGQDDTVGIGYIVDKRERWEEALERATPQERAIVDVDHRILLAEPHLVAQATERGIAVAVWTVDSAAEAEQLRQAGVTRFTTNQVERLLSWRDARSESLPR